MSSDPADQHNSKYLTSCFHDNFTVDLKSPWRAFSCKSSGQTRIPRTEEGVKTLPRPGSSSAAPGGRPLRAPDDLRDAGRTAECCVASAAVSTEGGEKTSARSRRRGWGWGLRPARPGGPKAGAGPVRRAATRGAVQGPPRVHRSPDFHQKFPVGQTGGRGAAPSLPCT